MNRAADLALVLLSAPFTLPLGAVSAALVRSSSKGPVLFRQERIGLNERPFMLYKFRTMSSDVDAVGNLLPDADRITRVGKFLRKTSLDELPQLLNIARGDMSFVGPRPLLPEYLPYYTGEERVRHRVRPGLTGLAQVSGRNNLSWHDRLRADVTYVRQRSLRLDAAILWRTLVKAIKRSDVAIIAGDTGEPLHVERSYPSNGDYALRRLYRRDLPLRVSWFNSPTALEHMQLGTITLRSTELWWEKYRRDANRADFSVIDNLGNAVAMTGLKKDSTGERAEFYLIVDPNLKGRGIGRVATELSLEWVRRTRFAKTVTLTVKKSNLPAIKIYSSLGFACGEESNERYSMHLAIQ